MTLRRLAVGTSVACLMGAIAFGQEPPKSLPPVPTPGQPKEMPPTTGKDKEKDKDKEKMKEPELLKEPVGGRPAADEPPKPIRPEIPGDIIDPQYRGTYVHATSTLHGGVTYEGPFPNGLFRAPNFHFGGFYAPAPYWPALSLPDYHYPSAGIHSQYFGYTPYTYGLWNQNPIPSPLAGGATYPEFPMKPGQFLPAPKPFELTPAPGGPMPPPGTTPGMGSVPAQPIPSAPQGRVPVLPAGRRR